MVQAAFADQPEAPHPKLWADDGQGRVVPTSVEKAKASLVAIIGVSGVFTGGNSLKGDGVLVGPAAESLIRLPAKRL